MRGRKGAITMREILFRGKRTDNGEWVYGYYVCKKRPYFKDKGVNLEHFICRNLEIENGDCKQFVDTIMTVHLVDSETIGQYIGETDTNGRKIFDGDIVWNNYEEERGIVRWDDNVDFDSIYGDELEIIGNIYDNPELLKTNKEK